MNYSQANDILLQIAELKGQVKVREDRIEQLTADIECVVIHEVKDNLDERDLEEINQMRHSLHLEAYYTEELRKRIASLEKSVGIDEPEEESEVQP